MAQAGAPITARESLRDSPDKKNPGEEGYGSLQGRGAAASYNPNISRSVVPSRYALISPSLSALAHVGHCWTLETSWSL